MTSSFFSCERLADAFPQILEKLPVTFEIVLVATVIGLAAGTLLALIRIKKIPVLNQLAFLLISFLRGTPALVLMFVVYYGMPMFFRAVLHIDLSDTDAMVFVFVTFGLNQAGYMAEQIRAAILSVPVGQTEAAYSVGLTQRQAFTRIVFPQAIKVAIPGLETMFVTLFQDTALAYMIGVVDMMGKVKLLAAVTFHSIEGYTCVAVIFIVISLVLEKLFSILNRKMAFEGREEA